MGNILFWREIYPSVVAQFHQKQRKEFSALEHKACSNLWKFPFPSTFLEIYAMLNYNLHTLMRTHACSVTNQQYITCVSKESSNGSILMETAKIKQSVRKQTSLQLVWDHLFLCSSAFSAFPSRWINSWTLLVSFLEAGAPWTQLTKIMKKEWVYFNWKKKGPMLNTESDELGKFQQVIRERKKRKEEKKM